MVSRQLCDKCWEDEAEVVTTDYGNVCCYCFNKIYREKKDK